MRDEKYQLNNYVNNMVGTSTLKIIFLCCWYYDDDYRYYVLLDVRIPTQLYNQNRNPILFFSRFGFVPRGDYNAKYETVRDFVMVVKCDLSKICVLKEIILNKCTL